MTMPRGIRNRNPGNVERNAIKWHGMSANQTDPRFIVFDDMTMGVRCSGKILLTYYLKHGLNTVRGILNRWAPVSENDTGSYVRNVSAACGVCPNKILRVDDPATLTKLLRAIFHHENGGHFVRESDLAKGVALALGAK